MHSTIETVLSAVRAGAECPREPEPAGALLEREAEQGMAVMFRESDPGAVALVSRTREAALVRARAGDLAAAEAGLREAMASLDGAVLATHGLLGLRSAQHAAESYLHYRAGRLPRADETMREALRLVNRLQGELGDEGAFLEARRVHLAQNLIRVHLRAGQAAEAMRVAAGLLGYLEGDDAAWPVPGEASSTGYRLPHVQAALFFAMVAGDAGAVLASRPREEAPGLLEPLRPHLRPAGTGPCAAFPRPHQWLALRALHREGPAEGFVAAAPGFLAGGRAGVGPLWDLLVGDVLAACEELGIPGAAAAREEVVRLRAAQAPAGTASSRPVQAP